MRFHLDCRAIIENLPRLERSKFVSTTTGKTPISVWSRAKQKLDELMLQNSVVVVRLIDTRTRSALLPPARVNAELWRVGLKLPKLHAGLGNRLACSAQI